MQAKGTAQDAISIILADHRKVEELFSEFEQLGERAVKSKRKTVEQICEELTIHAEMEEQLFYPAFRKASKQDDEVLEAVEEHLALKLLIAKLLELDVDDERLKAKVTVLKEIVQHHVKEEEKEMLPEARKVLKDQLATLGEQMLPLKQQAKTRVRVTMMPESGVREKQR
jgi:hemerythrin superfamily protein